MPAVNASKFYVSGGWDDVPHIDEKTKREIEENTPPHLRAARMRGEPSLGAGAVYAVSPDTFRCAPFAIPDYFRRGYGLDVGWNCTAAIFGAHDVDNDILYLISEHYRGEAPPSVHADAIKARPKWQPGFIDPASQGSSQLDGKRIIDEYRKYELRLQPADNAVEAGIMAVRQRLESGRLKVFSTLTNWFNEYRFYIRDEKTGKVIKKNDHCLHPDTLVLTDSGARPIRDLVGTSGKVLSSDGQYHEYRNCRLTACDQEIVEVTFDDGSTVRCTPDHKFLTVDGWVEAVDLKGKECHNALSHSVKAGNPCSSGSYQTQSKSFLANGTTFAEDISSATGDGFMSRSGRMSTAVSHLKAITCTTGTKIVLTISQAISSFCQRANTLTTIMLGAITRRSRWHMSVPLSGTNQMWVARGIVNTTKALRPSYTSVRYFSASVAGQNSPHPTEAAIAFAATPAGQSTASTPVSTMSSARAPSVDQNSRSTSTGKLEPAAAPATVRCLEVRAAGRSDVYCMTVPSTAAFAVEGGVVVHNCLDATRYLVMSIAKMAHRPMENTAMMPMRRPIDRRAGY